MYQMKNRILKVSAILVLGLAACSNNPNQAETKPKEEKQTLTKKNEAMNNLISIVEIPITDFSRAVGFYQAILGISIKEVEMDGVKMGVLPNEEGTVNVVLAKGTDYKPTTDGAVLYLNAGKDLQSTLDKVEKNGGQVIVPKTQISPEMGFFALFIDTEGNKMGLHSTN
jgi:predicted enzyme related to lactoylglutathione lyase